MKKDLRIAIEENDEVAINNLLANGTNINANIPGEKFAPIHYSAGLHTSITRLLLHHGADPNIKTIDGLTPLHIAAAWGHQSIIKELLANGANAEIRDNDGNTPMDLAREYEYSQCMRILERHISKAKHPFSNKNNHSPKTNPAKRGDSRDCKTPQRSRPKMCNLKTTFLMTPENISSRIKITLRDCDKNSESDDSQHYSAFPSDVNSRKNRRDLRTERSDSKRTSADICSFLNTDDNKYSRNFNTANSYYTLSDTETVENLTEKDSLKENGKFPEKQLADNISYVSTRKRLPLDSSNSTLEVNSNSTVYARRKQSNRSHEKSDIGEDLDKLSFNINQNAGEHDLTHSGIKWLKRAKKYVHIKVMSCTGQNKQRP
ncbi:hypothetical protein Ahia01_000134300 [Argonauta hians]